MSQSQCHRNDNNDEAYSPKNSRSEHTVQSTYGNDQMMKNMRSRTP